MNNKKKYYYIDLFSGPGGLCTGFKNEGFYPLIAVEISDWTIKTYKKNHDVQVLNIDMIEKNIGKLETILENNDKTVLIHGDVRRVTNDIILEILDKKFNKKTVDVVAGGPPCESFSMAGKRAEEDDRNDLFHNLLRIGHLVKAKFIFFENVPGLLTKKRDGKKGGQFEYIVSEFEKEYPGSNLKYTLKSKVKEDIKLLAADYGVPQKRERIFLVASNSIYGENTFSYPKKTHGEGCKYNYVTVGDALSNLPRINSGEGQDVIKYELTDEISSLEFDKFISFIKGREGFVPEHIEYEESCITSHKAVNHREKMIERFKYIEQGEGMKKAAERLIEEGRTDVVNNYFPRKLYAARNRRLKISEPSFTVTSHCLDEMLHPTLNRQLTPREVARLQSFPDWYQIEGPYVKFHSDPEQDKYEQIGDAIPVLLVRALAKELYNALEKIIVK